MRRSSASDATRCGSRCSELSSDAFVVLSPSSVDLSLAKRTL